MYNVRISPGTRVGYWHPEPHPGPNPHLRAFTPIGIYEGPDLGDPVIGTRFTQKLMEGDIEFSVGVLFRPDLGKRQRLEPILILHRMVPEMFNYVDWAAV